MKLASTRYLDALPTEGSEAAHAFRDLEMEAEVHKLTQALGIGAQFGGKYFCHDVRVIRLPRHGASLPIGLGVSCSADRQALGKITRDGVFLEELETQPGAVPARDRRERARRRRSCAIDLNRPMADILGDADAAPDPHAPRRSTGTMIVARDLAHAKLRERLERGEAMPDYFKNHPVYYAGPAKTPAGHAVRLLRPDHGRAHGRPTSTSSRPTGGSMVMLAKGNRSKAGARGLQEARRLLSRLDRRPGGAPRAGLHQKVEVLEYPELGMEAIWRIEVENFPAFIVIDDKGNDFFRELNLG